MASARHCMAGKIPWNAARVRDIAELARRIRVHTLRMTHRAGSAHVGSSFSMADLLAVLYSEVLRVDPQDAGAFERDRFILSKGHGCAGLYAVLAEMRFFPAEWLDTFYLDGGRLAGHATNHGVPGIEASTGSLGHGLSIACGMAKALADDSATSRVFALLSDGECDEGSTWEAALFSAHHRLANLTCIVDYNKIQSLGHVDEVLRLEPFVDKWRAFGWAVEEIDGHNIEQIVGVCSRLPLDRRRPSCLIAHTVKGKGVSFMEDTVLWHYRSPQGDEFQRALVELGEEA